ncbi:hypothetical protein HAX54_025149 [Datura stramonium]|uniref:RNase H type-1 domain-containing protein n=1 Tax=Datura stramonium TaxID=4076 RepID=A0ABS8S6U8_DATST|nr:hypothetical protein [Datura stramonium]
MANIAGGQPPPPRQWSNIVHFLEGYRPKVEHLIVNWSKPTVGRYKCNVDGASKGNLGESSIAFCVRNHNGDLMYAEATTIGVNHGITTEAKAMVEGLKYCIEK